MIKYTVLDIETSDLIQHPNNVLTLSLVADVDTALPLDELPYLNLLFLHKPKSTSDFALTMNRDIFMARALATGVNPGYASSMFDIDAAQTILSEYKLVNNWDAAYPIIKDFVTQYKIKTLAGKNVASFDLHFMPADVKQLFGHRCLDPGSMYVRYDDVKIPDQSECLKRAGLPSLVTHDAYEDNIQVIKLIRNYFTQQEVQDGLRSLRDMG
jgi:hypothetical protein